MAKELEGKVAVVTGAARNQGRAYSEMLATHGANVVVHHHGETSRAEAEKTADALRRHGPKAVVVQADLTQVPEVRRLFEMADENFGRLDILINNAGMVLKKPLTEITEAEYDRMFGINAKAAFFCMREAAKRMQDGGRIINIATSLLGAFTGLYAVYAGSKAPLEDFTRALAKEIGHRGITVNTVAPGPLDTSFFYPAETPDAVAYHTQASVQARLGRIDDIVPLIELLVLPKGGWITGQILFINGGYVTR